MSGEENRVEILNTIQMENKKQKMRWRQRSGFSIFIIEWTTGDGGDGDEVGGKCIYILCTRHTRIF